MTVHEIFIPKWRPAGLNELMNCHWTKKARLKKRDKNIVASYCLTLPDAEGKRKIDVEFVLGFAMRRRDEDNEKKSLLDALVQCRALKDDNRTWLENGEITYSRDWENWGTKITLTDLN